MTERKVGKHPALGMPYGTATGRIPSRGPMPQSNHPRTELGRKILEAFTK